MTARRPLPAPPSAGPASARGRAAAFARFRAGLYWAALALLACAVGPVASADAPRALPQDVSALRDLLGTPAHPDAVREALQRLDPGDGPGAERMAIALGRAGGHAAVEPLAQLLSTGKPATRRAALRSLARVNIRSEGVTQRICEVIRQREGEERRLAILLLGRLGDGHSVDLLLAQASAEDVGARRAAMSALSDLASVKIPPVAARWKYWWRTTQPRLRRDLHAHLRRLGDSPDAAAAARWLQSAQATGWVDLPAVEQTLQRWMRKTDPTLRAHAVSLVAALRLGDLASGLLKLDLTVRRTSPLGSTLRQAVESMGLRRSAPAAQTRAEAAPARGG